LISKPETEKKWKKEKEIEKGMTPLSFTKNTRKSGASLLPDRRETTREGAREGRKGRQKGSAG